MLSYFFSQKNCCFSEKCFEDIVKKIQSYSHGEFNTESNIDINKINQKIENNLDIFDRGFKLKNIPIDESFPEYILNNKESLKNWIIS